MLSALLSAYLRLIHPSELFSTFTVTGTKGFCGKQISRMVAVHYTNGFPVLFFK